MASFEEILATASSLNLFFIPPLLIGTGGNTGTQSATPDGKSPGNR